MKRNIRMCCSSILGFAAALAFIAYYVSRPKSVFDYATKVADTTGWEPAKLMNRPLLQFCWVSPTEILYGRREDGLRIRLMRKRVDRPNEPPVALGLAVPVASIYWQVSPDGRSISWLNMHPIAGMTPAGLAPYQCEVASLDGGHVRQFPDADLESQWSADSSAMFVPPEQVASRSDTLLLRRVENASGKSSTIAFPWPAGWTDTNAANVRRWIPVHHFPDGRLRVVRNGLYVLPKPPRQGTTTVNVDGVDFADYDLNHITAPAQTWHVKRPPDIDVSSLLPSPQGDRIFWQTSKMMVSPLEALIQRVLPSYKVHPQRVIRLIVSDIRGNGMHDIAVYRGNPNLSRSPGATSMPQWTPDGLRISFVVKGNLYTIPAQ
jgi:hypothetical protein